MKRLLLPLVLAFSLAAQDFQTVAQQAVQQQQAGDFRAAEASYRQLLAMDPNQVATRVNLGVVLVNEAKYDEAIEQYRAALGLLPGDSRIQLNMALAYEKSGRVTEACEQFQNLHTAAPSDDKVTLLLADCSGQLGKDQQVAELLSPIAATHADDMGFCYMLGMALLHQHRVAEGQVYLDRILRQGDSVQARYLLATRMFESADYPAAVAQFRKAIEADPTLPHVYSFYGQALLNTGDPDGAAAAFRHALERDPNDFNANLGLAQILVVRSEFKAALPFAQRAESLRPDDTAGNLAAAESLAGLKDWRAAESYAEAAARLAPKSAQAHETLAQVYAARAKPNLAAQHKRTAEQLKAEANNARPGPKVNDVAPDFQLRRADRSETVSLSDYRGKSPVVLVFGSYSCPNFRDASEALKRMGAEYGARIPFLLIYVREAHSTGDWQSTRNGDRETLAPAATLSEKQDHANMCSRKLHLPFPALVDGMDNSVESAYQAWPSRLFIINTEGRVVYRTGLTELEFHPSEVDSVLQTVSKTKEVVIRQ